MRAALYWVPADDDPLFAAGSAWLGRDIRTGIAMAHPPIAGLPALTADARRYGLHATLRPPMRLAGTLDEFVARARALASACAPFVLPPLQVCDVGGFLALRESAACAPLQALAEKCVLGTEAYRAPPDAAELARRRAIGLSARQDGLLEAYGYPYVLDEWFFHVTLTRRLAAAETAWLRPVAEGYFAAVLGVRRVVEGVCVCVEEEGAVKVKQELLF